MTRQLCECGYQAEDHLAFQDHLQESFTPQDGKAADGAVHDEIDGAVHDESSTGLACLCGFFSLSADELDKHFLTVFTPADSIGLDGHRHAAVTSQDRS